MEQELRDVLRENPSISAREIGLKFGINRRRVLYLLNKFGILREERPSYTPFKEKEPINLEPINDLIIGSLLGDGSITKWKKDSKSSTNVNSKLVIKHAINQKEYACMKKGLFDQAIKSYSDIKQRLDPRGWNVQATITISTQGNVAFNNIRDTWYPNGIKIVPRNIKLTPLSLAIWFQDDGSNHKKGGYYLHSNNFSYHDQLFLQSLLLDLGIESRLNKITDTHNIYIRKRSVKLFNLLILPFVHESMKYKLKSD